MSVDCQESPVKIISDFIQNINTVLARALEIAERKRSAAETGCGDRLQDKPEAKRVKGGVSSLLVTLCTAVIWIEAGVTIHLIE